MNSQQKAYRKSLRHLWRGVLHRCLNPTCKDYWRYGGRGITVCARWRESFDSFFSDAGQRPPGGSLDRVDNDGGYWCGSDECPECGPLGRDPNCRWATPLVQAGNRRPPSPGPRVPKVKKTGRFYLSGGSHHPGFIDIAGQTFGRLKAVRLTTRTRPASPGAKLWECVCECGKTVYAESNRLRNGRVRSCGCLARELTSKRLRKNPVRRGATEYNIWTGIKSRCHNPNDAHYPDYGGRGIVVCERWRNSFADFYADMGARPAGGFSLDRIDNDKGYEPGNCRWATRVQQNRNKRNNRCVVWNGETKTVVEWAAALGLNPVTLYWRLNHWSVEKAFTSPKLSAGKGRPRTHNCSVQCK